MTTLNNDELREEMFEVLNCYDIDASEVSDGMTYIGSDEAFKIVDQLLPIVATHDQQLLGAILDGAEPNPTTPAGENEFVPVEHIKSVFKKEGE